MARANFGKYTSQCGYEVGSAGMSRALKTTAELGFRVQRD